MPVSSPFSVTESSARGEIRTTANYSPTRPFSRARGRGESAGYEDAAGLGRESVVLRFTTGHFLFFTCSKSLTSARVKEFDRWVGVGGPLC
jgi:hypothetical protein